MSLLLAPLGIILDRVLGEPCRAHPLVGFGNLAARMERLANRGHDALQLRLAGMLALLVLVLPPVLLALLIPQGALGMTLEVLILYLALGYQSLRQHGMRVWKALTAGDLEAARHRTAWLVSRDTSRLDEAQLSAATVESVLENGCDAVFGALFWFALLGAPGVIAYRLVNTLDAMWGYRNDRFVYFGWAAARLDDVMNYIPARLTALSYALCGHMGTALSCWYQQARNWKSPNAGPVMAAGAGALSVQLGGPAVYHGRLEHRPDLGRGRPSGAVDILRALQLLRRSVLLWLVLMTLLGLLLAPGGL